MKHKYAYYLGCILLFLGLLWMFLPHATHHLIEIPSAENQEHIADIFEGLASVLAGLGFILLSEKYSEKTGKGK